MSDDLQTMPVGMFKYIIGRITGAALVERAFYDALPFMLASASACIGGISI